MACECELQNTLDVEVTQDALLDVEIGGSAGVLLQAKSVEITENGISVVAPDDGFDGLKSVEINTNVPKRFECGDAVFDTNAYNGMPLYGKITRVYVSCLVNANTKTVYSLFSGFISLTDIFGLETWDTSSVERMEDLFRHCEKLKQLDVSNFDTSKVTNAMRLFSACFEVESLDTSGWDTSSFKDIRVMFEYCRKLKSIDTSNWYLPLANVGIRNEMFRECFELLSIIGDKTLQDVENGTVAMRGIKSTIETNHSSKLRFSSILAIANGFADMTGETALTLMISSKSYNNMYNDDDTIPTADVIAERQARIAAICAAKNWNFSH